jgi:hypothetical protein
MRRFALSLFVAGCGAAPAPAPQPADDPDLAAVTLPALPEWTDKYRAHDAGDMRFFRLDALMARHGLSRLDAVEVQNRFRDLTRADEAVDRGEAFRRALADVKAGQRESGLSAEALEKAEFVVAFDLDDTLYDQYRATADCHDLAFALPNGKTKHIKLTPGWDEALRRVKALGGLVVLYSANRDEVTYANLRAWTLDGAPLTESPLVDGILTNSFLMLQDKADGDPVVTPSKDLRFLDPKLERAILVDDNPTRVFHMRNTRIFKKFRAPDLCGGDESLKKAQSATLPAVVAEIEQSVAWARAEKAPFARAYLPYTALGRHAVEALRAGGMAEEEAVDYVRRHPDVVDEAY